jgi:putative transposase
MWFTRQSVRLRGYDYATAGVYFITVCAQDRAPRLAAIRGSETHLATEGEIAKRTWLELPKRFPTVELDEFIVMPNHIHGIVILNKQGGACPQMRPSPAPTYSAPPSTKNSRPRLGLIVGTFKSFSSARINREHGTRGPFWQRSYYEHIIRSGKSLDVIRRYIHDNPQRWSFDRENPNRSLSPANVSNSYWRGSPAKRAGLALPRAKHFKSF